MEDIVINDFSNLIGDKRVLFITTKEKSYIRNSQEIRLLEKEAKELKVIASKNNKYFARLLEVYGRIFKIKNKSYDIVFVGFAPQLVLPLFGWKFRNKEVIIDFFVSIYDTLVLDRKRISEKSILSKIMHFVDDWTLKQASKVVVDTKADMNFFSKEFSCEKDKFSVLYLEADEKIYYPREQRKPQALREKFVVLYFGSILPLQGVKVILEAIELLKDNERIYFQMIGPIDEKYKKPIQQNVEYIEWLSQEELAEYIANADLCLAGHFSGNIDKANRTIPGKAYIYKAMEKKIILGDSQANRELYNESNKNVKFIKMGNSIDLVEAILNAI